MQLPHKTLKNMIADAWDQGFKAAADNDCCGCNLSVDDEGNEIVNPYRKED